MVTGPTYIFLEFLFQRLYTNVNSNIIIFICFVDLKLMTPGGTKIPQQFSVVAVVVVTITIIEEQ